MNINVDSTLAKIETLYTLGPEGTNCAEAAKEWFRRRNKKGKILLYQTLESAVKEMPMDSKNALIACIVYPELHTLVFTNLHKLLLAECFTYPTFNMLLASRNEQMPRSVSTHPAPQSLVPENCEIRYTTSNSQAAIDCRNAITDGCITTLPAARKHGLFTIKDYGPIPMGFTVHIPKLS